MRRAAGIVCFSVVRRASYSRTLSGHSQRGNVKSNLRIPQHGVPPLGGGAWANTMTLKMFGAIEKAGAPPAEAGTPNLRIQAHDLGNRPLPVPLLPPREERGKKAAVRSSTKMS